MKLEFTAHIFLKNAQILNFLKLRLVGAELFRADRRTDRGTDGQTALTKLIVIFRNFANAHKNAKNYSGQKFIKCKRNGIQIDTKWRQTI
jgi:hypothetical protein